MSLPSEIKHPIVELICLEGDLFICGFCGNPCCLEEIEKELLNAEREWPKEEGIYLYEAYYISAETGEFGRIELPAYWEFKEIYFKPSEESSDEN